MLTPVPAVVTSARCHRTGKIDHFFNVYLLKNVSISEYTLAQLLSRYY